MRGHSRCDPFAYQENIQKLFEWEIRNAVIIVCKREILPQDSLGCKTFVLTPKKIVSGFAFWVKSTFDIVFPDRSFTIHHLRCKKTLPKNARFPCYSSGLHSCNLLFVDSNKTTILSLICANTKNSMLGQTGHCFSDFVPSSPACCVLHRETLERSLSFWMEMKTSQFLSKRYIH